MTTKMLRIIPLVTLCALTMSSSAQDAIRDADISRLSDMIDARFGGIPENFPDDVVVYPNLRGIMANELFDAFIINGKADESVDEVVAYYESRFDEEGWTRLDSTDETPGFIELEYQRGERHITVGVGLGTWQQTSNYLIISKLASERAAPRKPDSPEANRILKQALEVYATCDMYSDTGYVETKIINRGSSWSETLRFKTSFVRPDLFRFEYVEDTSRYIVHSDANGTKTSWDVTGIEDEDSLEMAIAGATGVSSGSAHTIPSKLLGYSDSFYLRESTLLPEEKLNGILCFRIEGRDRRDDIESLWIEKGNYLIRRVDSSHTFPDFRTEETTTYEPQINAAIPPEELAFHPEGLIAISWKSRIAEHLRTSRIEELLPSLSAWSYFGVASAVSFIATICLLLVEWRRKRRANSVRVSRKRIIASLLILSIALLVLTGYFMGLSGEDKRILADSGLVMQYFSPSSGVFSFDAGPYQGGTAIIGPNDMAFWVAEGKAYTVNQAAREVASELSQAPNNVKYDDTFIDAAHSY